MEESTMKRRAAASNPFTTSVAGGSDFCDRKQELAELERLVQDGQSIVLSSPRRYGKTSLALHLQDRLREQRFLTCLLYTSDAADDLLCVDLGGRRIIKKKKKQKI